MAISSGSGPSLLPMRGGKPSPASAMAKTPRHSRKPGAPPNFIIPPPATISAWGNVQYPGVPGYGDCTTAEEAFAKACHNPEIFIADGEVIRWASQHYSADGESFLNGASCYDVLVAMQSDGFHQDNNIYDDGQINTVDYETAATLQSAITEGPVKIAISDDQLTAVWHNNGGRNGWFCTGFGVDHNITHVTSLFGYGTLAWLAQQLKVQLPAGIDGNSPGYAMFTWNSLGIIDHPSMVAITSEAWLRKPTTIVKP